MVRWLRLPTQETIAGGSRVDIRPRVLESIRFHTASRPTFTSTQDMEPRQRDDSWGKACLERGSRPLRVRVW
jgi:hypothetical protein